MPNVVEVNYEQTGQSKSTNEFGMRDIEDILYHLVEITEVLFGKVKK